MHHPLMDAKDGCVEATVEALAGGGGPGPRPNRTTAVTTLRSGEGEDRQRKSGWVKGVRNGRVGQGDCNYWVG